VAPQRGQIMALAQVPGGARLSHVVYGPGGYAIPKEYGTACVGATHESAGFDARVTTGGLKYLADLSTRLLPGYESATVKHVWMGFRPVLLADGLPPVGKLPGLENGYVAAGHGAIGVTVSAAVGYLLTQLIRGDTPDQPLSPFDPAAYLLA
jgi:glycine oxidase